MVATLSFKLGSSSAYFINSIWAGRYKHVHLRWDTKTIVYIQSIPDVTDIGSKRLSWHGGMAWVKFVIWHGFTKVASIYKPAVT